MALVRALVKAANIVKRSKFRLTAGDGRSIIEIFDQALREAGEARQDEVREKEVKKDMYMPLSLSMSKIAAGTNKLRRLSAANEKQPATIKGRWGKAGAKVLLSQGSAPSCLASAGSPPVAARSSAARVDKLKDLDFSGKPLTMEENVAKINKDMAAMHKKLESATLKTNQRVDACQEALMARLATLETAIVKNVSAQAAETFARTRSIGRDPSTKIGRNTRGHAQRPLRAVKAEGPDDAAVTVYPRANADSPAAHAAAPAALPGSVHHNGVAAAVMVAASGGDTQAPTAVLNRIALERMEMREVDQMTAHVPASPFDA